MSGHSRSSQFWKFQLVFWGIAGSALFVSGATQMPILQAAVRNLFLVVAGFLASFFLAIFIDHLRGMTRLRQRVFAYASAYIISLFCVVSINAITYTMRGTGLEEITFGQWFSGTMNLALVFAFWAELFIQQVYAVSSGRKDLPPLEKLTVDSGGALVALPVTEVVTIQAAGDYVEIHTRDRTYLDRNTLQAMESRLLNNNFLRVHRSFLINASLVESVKPLGKGRFRINLEGGIDVESSRGYKEIVRRRLL
jgi:DNA-binding LytR/AlgR family response regulator